METPTLETEESSRLYFVEDKERGGEEQERRRNPRRRPAEPTEAPNQGQTKRGQSEGALRTTLGTRKACGKSKASDARKGGMGGPGEAKQGASVRHERARKV